MIEKKPQNDKIDEICKQLPDWASGFFWETGTQLATSTRLAYAREINVFFDYLTTYVPEFSELDKSEITLDQFADITSQDISRYLTKFQDKGNMERTLARKRAALSSFCNYLVINRKIPFNPVLAAAKVKIHQSDEVLHLNMKEQIAFLKSVESGNKLTANEQKWHKLYRTRDLALITLLLDTGMRVSELHGIDIIDVDLEFCFVVVVRKGGNVQSLYFSDSTRDLLKDYIEERRHYDEHADGKYPLFTTTTGDRLGIRAIQKLVKKYARAAIPGKGKKISPHKMRASFAMEYYSEEKDLLALQRKLGHKNLGALNAYAQATDQQMQETRSVLEERKKRLLGDFDDRSLDDQLEEEQVYSLYENANPKMQALIEKLLKNEISDDELLELKHKVSAN